MLPKYQKAPSEFIGNSFDCNMPEILDIYRNRHNTKMATRYDVILSHIVRGQNPYKGWKPTFDNYQQLECSIFVMIRVLRIILDSMEASHIMTGNCAKEAADQLMRNSRYAPYAANTQGHLFAANISKCGGVLLHNYHTLFDRANYDKVMQLLYMLQLVRDSSVFTLADYFLFYQPGLE